jgi:hypothetical protein
MALDGQPEVVAQSETAEKVVGDSSSLLAICGDEFELAEPGLSACSSLGQPHL